MKKSKSRKSKKSTKHSLKEADISPEILEAAEAIIQPRRYEAQLFGSVEAEDRLNRAIAEIQACPSFSYFKDRTLGQYWTSTSVRAPFEEALTIKQLSEMNLEALLKKRSFTAKKLEAMLAALNNAMSQTNPAAQATKESQRMGRAKHSGLQAHLGTVTSVKWRAGGVGELPMHLRALISQAEKEMSQIGEPGRSLTKLFKETIPALSAREYLVMALAVDHELATLSSLLKWSDRECEETLKAGREVIKDIFFKNQSEMLLHWVSSLAGPGVSWNLLVEPYLDDLVDLDLQRIFARLLLGAIGARELSELGRLGNSYWSSNPQGFAIAFDALVATLPKNDEQLTQAFASLFPLYDQGDLYILLKKRAALIEGFWRPFSS